MDNNTIQRRIEVYRIELSTNTHEVYDKHIFLQDALETFFKEYSTSTMSNGYSVNRNKKCWVELAKSESSEYDSLKVKMSFTKFNKKVSIVDVSDKTIIGRKDLNEGDLEKQHLLIRFLPESNIALLVFEKISDSITITFLEKTINNYIKQTFLISPEYINEDIKRNDFRLNLEPIVSRNFIESIANLKGVNALKAIILKDSLDDDRNFSGQNSRDEAELIFKAARGLKLNKRDVITYCKKFITNGRIDNSKVNRIIIEGTNLNDNKIRLDTEGMKLSEHTSILMDESNTVDTDDIFQKFYNLLDDCWQYLETLLNITIAENIEEV